MTVAPESPARSRWRIAGGFLRRHALIGLVNVLFVAFAAVLVAVLPPTAPFGGPDESTHMEYNVDFIRENGRLPVSGVDDVSAYQACREDSGFRVVPCLYSYQVYPAANYVAYAVGAAVGHDALGTSYLTGARIVSVLFGLVFLTMLYATVLLISRSTRVSAALAFAIGCIPQVIFVSSYVNQDAHSLAISAVVGYAATRFALAQRPGTAILLGIALGGLLPLAKYNYFVLLPLAVALVAIVVFRHRPERRVLVTLGVASVAGFALLSAFWYIRNLVLYRDLTGQGFVVTEMSKYHELGAAHPLSVDSLVLYAQKGFFELSFESFFLTFGYMNLPTSDRVYLVTLLVIAVVIAAAVVIAVISRGRDLWLVGAAVVLVVGGAVFLSLWNALKFDFQPQGRYLFAVLVPVAMAVAFAFRRSRLFAWLLVPMVGLTALLLWAAAKIVVGYYLV